MAHHVTHAWQNKAQDVAPRRTPCQVFRIMSAVLVGILVHLTCQAQIDPYRRELLQFGCNQPVTGH